MLLVEELAARAWPAAETLRVDGWLLRHTPSLTRRRSNSALPLGDAGGGLSVVEDFYAGRGARPRVQVSPAEERAGLDAELDGRGWSRDGPTDVLVADVDAVLAHAQPGAVALARASRPRLGGGLGGVRGAPRRRRACPRGARAHRAGGRLCARGRRPRRRARGLRARLGGALLRRHAAGAGARHRRHVVHGLARWAAGRGATGLYLQVEAGNAAAQRLGARTGFRRAYGYHYRVAPERLAGSTAP